MSTAAIHSDWVGRVIDGRFPLLKWLGGSEWRGVFLTELEGPGSQKATIKLIQPKDGDEEAYVAGWAAAKRLSHPNLMRLLETGHCVVDGAELLYVVTEYAEEVLSEIIVERPLKPDEVKEMLVPVLDALFYLHGKGFVHGHLKPSNILAVGNLVKLSTDNLELAGKPSRHFRALNIYDAPEIDGGTFSPASDVWSLGVTLVEVLTQHKPALERLTNPDLPAPEPVPEPFARIARECLREDPAQRCTLSDVNKARFEKVRAAPEPVSQAERTMAAKPLPLRMGVIAAAVVVLVVVVLIVALHGRSHRAETPSATEQKQAVPEAAPTQPEPAGAVSKGAVPATRTQAAETGSSGATGAQASSETKKGVVAERVMPDVPQKSLDTIHGTVKVEIRVAVDESGNVTDARFEPAGPSRYFANLAMDAARKWRFEPTQIDGRAVRSAWILQFDFQRTGTEVTPVEVFP